MATISLCIITKNEELFLEQCLNSVKELVDEIIVVDTGSSDKTKEIAQKFTNKVYDFEWCDDFSKARNESLKYATKDWILVLDADESISKEDHKRIRSLIESTKAVGFALIHRNYINDSSAAGWISSNGDEYPESKVASGWYPVPIIRLFKNDINFRFNGTVHESVYDSLVKVGDVLKTDIPLHHYGKLDKDKFKEKFYERLGECKIKREDNDFYAYYELGRQYANNGRLEKAVEALEKSIELKRDYFESWFMLGSVYLLKDELDKSLSKLRKAQSLNQNYPAVYANLGIIFAKKKEYKKSIENFINAIRLNPRDATAYKNLGLCYDMMGDKEKAYLAFKKAVELNPKYKESIKVN